MGPLQKNVYCTCCSSLPTSGAPLDMRPRQLSWLGFDSSAWLGAAVARSRAKEPTIAASQHVAVRWAGRNACNGGLRSLVDGRVIDAGAFPSSSLVRPG